MKAIELVRKVAQLGGSLREARERGDAMANVGHVVALRIVQATTVAARQMQSLPMPAPRPAERVVLSTAAAQLRAMAEMADLGASTEPGTAQIETALAALISETLALVEKVLATDPELAPERPRPALRAVGEDDSTPRKIRF